MKHVAGVFQGRLASMTFKFAARVFSFCVGPKRTLADDGGSTTRAVSVTRQAYVSPYERAIAQLEQLLAQPCIAPIVHPLLIDANAHTAAFKEPTQPLQQLFARGCTLNILLNELQSPFVATIDLYECADNGCYEGHQIDLFWRGCVGAGLVGEDALGMVRDRYDVRDGECLELMMRTVDAILARLPAGQADARYMRPRDLYPTARVQAGAARHAVLAAELARTEEAYVQDLERLVDLADAARALAAADVDVDAIFAHTHELLALHRQFSMRIQYIAAMPLAAQLLGAAYAGLDARFDVYSAFCARREQSQRALARAQPVLQQLGGDVHALLLRPVQRLAQYPLLLQGIVDALCASCAALPPATQAARVHVVRSAYRALHASKQALTRANESTRAADNAAQHALLLARLDAPELAHGCGRLLTSGPVSAQTSAGFAPAEAFLFERALLVVAAADAPRAARIRRTLDSLRAPSRRRRRRSADSASLPAHSPSPPRAATGFRLPSIDAGCALTLASPPLSSHASLATLRGAEDCGEKAVTFAVEDCEKPEDDPKPRLALRARIDTAV
ncbi:Guanine nucleotide exchange factor for Cdc42p, partial [Coemansia sp. RSA 2708]